MMDQKSMKMSEVWPAPVFINCDKSESGTGLCDPNESIPTHILPFYWKKVFQGHKNQGNPSVFHPHMGSDNGTKNPGSPHEGKKDSLKPFPEGIKTNSSLCKVIKDSPALSLQGTFGMTQGCFSPLPVPEGPSRVVIMSP